MEKPWIGIPTRYHDKSETLGQIRYYLDAIIWAGGLPMMIPTVESPELVREYARRMDGLLLPGSPTDINPKLYGAEPHPRLGKPYPERDSTDFVLLDYAHRESIPLLGICFGAQSLNVFRGGGLVQDIPSVVANHVPHDDAADDTPARHLVHFAEGSLLERLAGRSDLDVNSFHHQSIERPGKDLRVTATAPDGVIEAVEDTAGRFAVGIQWHPERNWSSDSFSRALFVAFVEEAKKSKSTV